MWNMLHVTYLAPIILRWFLGFWKNCATPSKKTKIPCLIPILEEKDKERIRTVPSSNIGITPNGTRDYVQVVTFFFTFMLPCVLIDFFYNQPDALIIPILFYYNTLHVSGIFSAHHQLSTVHSVLVSFMQVSDDRFQAQSGCASGWLFKKKYSYHLHQGSSFCFCSPHPTFPLTTFKSQYAANISGTLNEELYCLRTSP